MPPPPPFRFSGANTGNIRYQAKLHGSLQTESSDSAWRTLVLAEHCMLFSLERDCGTCAVLSRLSQHTSLKMAWNELAKAGFGLAKNDLEWIVC